MWHGNHAAPLRGVYTVSAGGTVPLQTGADRQPALLAACNLTELHGRQQSCRSAHPSAAVVGGSCLSRMIQGDQALDVRELCSQGEGGTCRLSTGGNQHILVLCTLHAAWRGSYVRIIFSAAFYAGLKANQVFGGLK